MHQYQALLKKIKNRGSFKSDRTGTGTYSIFGHQMRFDLNDGFPLVTTKQIYTKSLINELLWFLSGSTNAFDLPPATQKWWTPWCDKNGDLGNTYGFQYRKIIKGDLVTPLLFSADSPLDSATYEVGVYGNYDKSDRHVEKLKEIWWGMLEKCDDKNIETYKSTNGNGIHVENQWKIFANFQQDAKTLPNWFNKVENWDEYTIDKDILHASNRYSQKTCMWASSLDRKYNTPQINSVWLETNEVIRFRHIDQLLNVINNIKHDPTSRRLMINLWNAHDTDKCNLPPCHGNIIQFYVSNNKLSAHVYQRSADVFIGLPINIASYALLIQMIAQVCNLKMGELIYSLGDVHIYSNHMDQVDEQLQRTPKALPRMILTPSIDNINNFSFEDFTLTNYMHYPKISAPIAV